MSIFLKRNFLAPQFLFQNHSPTATKFHFHSQSTTKGLKKYKATKLLDCKSLLGECPIWDDRTNQLYWIDIDRKLFWTLDPSDLSSLSCYDTPEKPGSFAMLESSSTDFLFAFESGVYLYNPFTQTTNKQLFSLHENVRSRLNDGRCDRQGNFVFGGMVTQVPFRDRHLLPEWSNVYRLSPARQEPDVLIQNVFCSNSICFSLDGETMYFTDSVGYSEPVMVQYRYGAVLRKQRVFARIEDPKGFMDGSIVDRMGNVWNAEFGNGKVTCYDGGSGEARCVVEVPQEEQDLLVTCCTIGGKKMDTLYVTTCSQGQGEEEKGAGGLYKAELGSSLGLVENRFLV